MRSILQFLPPLVFSRWCCVCCAFAVHCYGKRLDLKTLEPLFMIPIHLAYLATHTQLVAGMMLAANLMLLVRAPGSFSLDAVLRRTSIQR